MTPNHQVRHTHTHTHRVQCSWTFSDNSLCKTVFQGLQWIPHVTVSNLSVCVFLLSWSLLNASHHRRMRTCVCGVLFCSIVCAPMFMLVLRGMYWALLKLLLMLGMLQATGWEAYPHWWAYDFFALRFSPFTQFRNRICYQRISRCIHISSQLTLCVSRLYSCKSESWNLTLGFGVVSAPYAHKLKQSTGALSLGKDLLKKKEIKNLANTTVLCSVCRNWPWTNFDKMIK